MGTHRQACVVVILFFAAPVFGQARRDLHGDSLPNGAIARIGTVRLRQDDQVSGICYSPDGKLLASKGQFSIHLWDAATGKPLWTIWPDYMPGPIWFLPDGRTLCAVSNYHTHWFDVASGTEIRKRPRPENARWFWAVSPGGKRVLHHDWNHCTVFDLASGAVVALMPREKRSIQFQPVWLSDKQIAVLCSNCENRDGAPPRSLRIWDIETGCQRRFPLGNGPPDWHAIHAMPGGKQIALACSKIVCLIDPATGREIGRFDLEHEDFRLHFSPDGATVAVQSSDRAGPIQLWDTASRKKRVVLHGNSRGDALAFAPDGKSLAAVHAGTHQIGIWDCATGKPLLPAMVLGNASPIGFLPDGRTLLAKVGNDIQAWDTDTGKAIGPPGKDWAPGRIAAMAPDGKAFVAESDSEWALLDASGNKRFVAATNRFAAAFDPQGKLLATGDAHCVVTLRSATDGKALSQFATWPPPAPADDEKGQQRERSYGDVICDLAFSPDSSMIAVADGHLGGSLWSVEPKKRLHTFTGIGYGSTVRFAPDGRSLALGGYLARGYGHCIIEVATGKTRAVLTGPNRSFQCGFSPDGRLFATADWWSVIVWDLVRGSKIASFNAHAGETCGLAFSPDGQRVAASYTNGTIVVWDVASRRAERLARRLERGEAEALWLGLSSDNAEWAFDAMRRLATAPAQSLPILRQHLKPAPHEAGQKIARQVAELNSSAFATRERAFRELRLAGDAARSPLELARARPATLEWTRRADLLLDAMPTITPETLRAIRAVEVLEMLGTPEARQLLETLADGWPDARLTREAQASLRRFSSLGSWSPFGVR